MVANRQVHLLAELIADLPIGEAINCADRAEPICPVLDPTLYRKKGSAFHVDLELLRAAAAFQGEVNRIKSHIHVAMCG